MINYKGYEIGIITGLNKRNGKNKAAGVVDKTKTIYLTDYMKHKSSAVRAAKRFIDQTILDSWETVDTNIVISESLLQLGERKNDNKTQFSYLDLESMEDMCKVLEFGAKKYARDNWKKGFPVSSIIDSLMRHLNEIMKGNLIDQESSLPHYAHIQCNAMFLAFTLKNKPDCYDFKKLQPIENQLKNKLDFSITG